MKKYLNNNKGMTLAEVIATLTITSFIVGLIVTAIFSINHQSKIVQQRSSDDNQLRSVNIALAKHTLESRKLYFPNQSSHADNNEFRFKKYRGCNTGEIPPCYEYKSIYFEKKTNGTNDWFELYLYNYDITVKDFDNPQIFNPTNPVYSNGIKLAGNIKTSEFIDKDGNVIQTARDDVSHFTLSIDFMYKSVDLYGNKDTISNSPAIKMYISTLDDNSPY